MSYMKSYYFISIINQWFKCHSEIYICCCDSDIQDFVQQGFTEIAIPYYCLFSHSYTLVLQQFLVFFLNKVMLFSNNIHIFFPQYTHISHSM